MKRALLFLLWLGCAVALPAREINLVQNPGFESVDPGSQTPTAYALAGSATWGRLGGEDELTTHGVIVPGDATAASGVAQLVRIDPAKGRWLLFRFRGLAQDGFPVANDSLRMKIEFFSKNGTNYLDCATRPLDGEIARDRQDFTVNGDFHQGGAAVWRSYELEELLPFPGIDAVRISVSYSGGAAASGKNAFLVDDFSLVQHAASVTGRVDPADRIHTTPGAPVDPATLVSLGGRWYYQPAAGETVSATTPLVVTEENADRLFYKSDRLINPFLDNMTAWLRAGYKDEAGHVVTQDRFVPDNVVLAFKGDGFLTITSKNLPNHPTAKFPGFNPSYIQEMTRTYRLPLDPAINPAAVAMTANDSNHALPMGPVGIAVNGVVFTFQPVRRGDE